MRLIFHGQLQKLYGDSVEMNSPSIADAVEGFSRQQEDWPREMPIRIIDHYSEDSLQECPDEIHMIPAMLGGGGKFGQIILGAALIVAAVVIGATALGAFFVPLIITGGMMILQGVVALFMKTPTVKSVNDPEASKYLAVNKNTTTNGTLITMAWGTIDLAGQWLSINSDSNNLATGTYPAVPT